MQNFAFHCIRLTAWMDVVFGLRSLFVAIALRKTIEDALAVVSLLMSAPFKVISRSFYSNATCGVPGGAPMHFVRTCA